MPKLRLIPYAVLTAGGLLVASGGAYAQSASNIDWREGNQQQRIDNGIHDGQLTPGETARLEQGQQRIDRTQARDESRGPMTGQERQQLGRMENRESRDIYRDRHDDQHAWGGRDGHDGWGHDGWRGGDRNGWDHRDADRRDWGHDRNGWNGGDRNGWNHNGQANGQGGWNHGPGTPGQGGWQHGSGTPGQPGGQGGWNHGTGTPGTGTASNGSHGWGNGGGQTGGQGGWNHGTGTPGTGTGTPGTGSTASSGSHSWGGQSGAQMRTASNYGGARSYAAPSGGARSFGGGGRR